MVTILTKTNDEIKCITAESIETLRDRIIPDGHPCWIITDKDIAELGALWNAYDVDLIEPDFYGEFSPTEQTEGKKYEQI